MDLHTLTDRLDARLRTADYVDIDASANGLQVGDDGEIEHVAFAVDAAAETIESAAGAGADLLVVHHGLIWGGLDRLTGRLYRRLAALFDNDIALYVSHLPLDGHQTLGNAAGVADVLDLENRSPFGEHDSEYIGQQGSLSGPHMTETVHDRLETSLDHGGTGVQVLEFGPDQLEEIAIVTGSGVDWLGEAVEVGADALITGEGKQQVYHEAKEAGITVFLAGHYATETFGVRSLQDLVAEWGLETTYVDHPTGL